MPQIIPIPAFADNWSKLAAALRWGAVTDDVESFAAASASANPLPGRLQPVFGLD